MDLGFDTSLTEEGAYGDAVMQLGGLPDGGTAQELFDRGFDDEPTPSSAELLSMEEKAKRKRRREQWEKEKADKQRWDLQRRLVNVSRDVELLTREVSRVRAELHVPLPPLSALPEPDRLALQQARARRQADLLVVYCKKTLTSTMQHKWSWPFNHAVDINLYPDYLDAVKQPIDFGTIKRRLDANQYSAADEFLADVRRVFDNARAYNKPGSDVHVMANTLQEKFEDKYAVSVVPRVAEEAAITRTEEEAARRRVAGAAAADAAREGGEARCTALLSYLSGVAAAVGEAKSVAAALCTPVSRAEKEALCATLGRLPQEHFEAAIGLVMHHHPGLQPFDDVAFDLDMLDALTLRQLASFVSACEAAEKERRRSNGGGGKADVEQVAWPQVPVGAGLRPYKLRKLRQAAAAAAMEGPGTREGTPAPGGDAPLAASAAPVKPLQVRPGADAAAAAAASAALPPSVTAAAVGDAATQLAQQQPAGQG